MTQSTAVDLCNSISPLFASGSSTGHIPGRKQHQYLANHVVWQRRWF